MLHYFGRDLKTVQKAIISYIKEYLGKRMRGTDDDDCICCYVQTPDISKRWHPIYMCVYIRNSAFAASQKAVLTIW